MSEANSTGGRAWLYLSSAILGCASRSRQKGEVRMMYSLRGCRDAGTGKTKQETSENGGPETKRRTVGLKSSDDAAESPAQGKGPREGSGNDAKSDGGSSWL